MFQRTALWGLLFSAAGLLSFACSGVSSDPDPTGSGGKGTGTGGRSGAGGGHVIVYSGGSPNLGGADDGSGGNKPKTGGAPGSGGNSPNECVLDAEEPCADHSSETPHGTALCTDEGWDLSDCTFCVPGEELSCATFDATTPDGTVVCDEDGQGWEEEPADACSACDESGPPADCDSEMNTTVKRGGVAACSDAGSYDWADCTLCDDDVEPPTCGELTDGERPVGTVVCDGGTEWNVTDCTECDPQDYEATIDCVDLVHKEHEFSGGVALCGNDASWEQSTCEYCGDGAVTGNEDCDPQDTRTTTCEALGYSNTDEVTCESSCSWATSVCSKCPGSDCLSGGSCSGQGCDDKECDGSCDFDCNNGKTCDAAVCGAGSNCDFACFNGGSTCSGISCMAGSTCAFDCYNGGKCQDVACTDASCSFNCENSGSVCSSVQAILCESGETCSFNCRNGGDCTGLEVVCKDGSTCEVDCDNNSSKCLTATCETGADCDLSCSNGTCPTVVGF